MSAAKRSADKSTPKKKRAARKTASGRDPRMALYWGEWKAVSQVLSETQGLSSSELEDERKRIHEETFGKPLSSRDIVRDNKAFDKILASFRAISQPDDMHAQLRQLNQDRTRIIWVIDRDLSEMGQGREYLAGILQRMSSEYAIPLHKDLLDYSFGDLQKIAQSVARTLRFYRLKQKRGAN